MRRDHRPFWAFHLAAAWREAQTHRFLAPQFDALGPHPMVLGPRHVEIVGAGIRAGAGLHLIASADAKIRLTTWPPPGQTAEIVICDAVLIVGGARILAARRIEIGDGTMLAANVVITDSDWHGLYDRVGPPAPKPVRIGRNVWIGDGAFIGKGVSIGDNSVIGTRAVVVRDIPANVVAAGNPARTVRDLDPDAPRRTRIEMLKDPQALADWSMTLHRQRLSGNSTLGWLRALFFPRRGD
jgi:acetyltransferase-like isoleucine patch superfamily enzyme